MTDLNEVGRALTRAGMACAGSGKDIRAEGDVFLRHYPTDPPLNRHGHRLNDDYLSAACSSGLDEEGCISNACCCACHAPTLTFDEFERLVQIIREGRRGKYEADTAHALLAEFQIHAKPLAETDHRQDWEKVRGPVR